MAAIICLGMAVRDLVFAVPELPPVPRKLTATALYKRGGGMAATAANAAAMLGGTVDYWGRLGDDETGRELRRELEAHGVRVEAPIVPGTQTPVAAVLVADSGERMLAVHRGQLDAATGWLPLHRVASVRAVHADFRWPEGARLLYEAARAHRIPCVLDADSGDADAVRALLPLADHAIFSQAGLAELVGNAGLVDDSGGGGGIGSGAARGGGVRGGGGDNRPDDTAALGGAVALEPALRRAASLTAGVVGVTLGERGSLFLINGVAHRIGAPAIVARDTNGAGDVFHGAYALALAEGRGVIDAARFATAAAALKCRNGSGWEAAPNRVAVDEFLKGSTW